MAQLVEWSLPIPKVHGSNPVIGKIYFERLFIVNCIEKTKIKKKEAGNGPFLKRRTALLITRPSRPFATEGVPALLSGLICALKPFSHKALGSKPKPTIYVFHNF